MITTKTKVADPNLIEALAYAGTAFQRNTQLISYISHISQLCDDEAQAVLNDLTDELYEINVLISATSQCVKQAL